VVDSSKDGNEPSDSIKGGEFLDKLSDSLSRTLLHGVSQTPPTIQNYITYADEKV
jgi:hypothetical protein